MSEHMDVSTLERRDEIAGALFSTWVIVGLFLDGWAHNVEKPEDFFTPWHAVLYSGFATASVWFGLQRVRRRVAGINIPTPPLVRLGFILFAVGGFADMVWHQIFGVEDDIEALLSPTHLTLMTGGVLLTTEPLRSALRRLGRAPSAREFAPAAVSLGLGVAVLAFFLQFDTAFVIRDHTVYLGAVDEQAQSFAIAGILLTNALLLGAMAFALRHWVTPRGTFTVAFGIAALLQTGLLAFDAAALVVPAVVAGAVADTLVARGRSARAVLLVTPAVLWTAWFAVYHAVWGLGWAVELWTGSIFFAVLTGFGLSLLGPPSNLASLPSQSARKEAKKGAGNGEGSGSPRAPRTPYRVLAELLT